MKNKVGKKNVTLKVSGNYYSSAILLRLAGQAVIIRVQQYKDQRINQSGSVIIEPILEKINFLKPESYKNYVDTCKKDAMVELLLEANNTYRTLSQ